MPDGQKPSLTPHEGQEPIILALETGENLSLEDRGLRPSSSPTSSVSTRVRVPPIGQGSSLAAMLGCREA